MQHFGIGAFAIKSFCKFLKILVMFNSEPHIYISLWLRNSLSNSSCQFSLLLLLFCTIEFKLLRKHRIKSGISGSRFDRIHILQMSWWRDFFDIQTDMMCKCMTAWVLVLSLMRLEVFCCSYASCLYRSTFEKNKSVKTSADMWMSRRVWNTLSAIIRIYHVWSRAM